MSKINIEFNPDLMTVKDMKIISSTMRDLVAFARQTEDLYERANGDYTRTKLMEDFFWGSLARLEVFKTKNQTP